VVSVCVGDGVAEGLGETVAVGEKVFESVGDGVWLAVADGVVEQVAVGVGVEVLAGGGVGPNGALPFEHAERRDPTATRQRLIWMACRRIRPLFPGT